jgi:hypothetical protein
MSENAANTLGTCSHEQAPHEELPTCHQWKPFHDPAPREATEEELHAQRAGYVRAEMAFGTDRQEAQERREATEEAPQPNSRILVSMLYRCLARLHLAVKGCAAIGFQESSPTTNAHHASIWNDLNEAQKDAELKLKHYLTPATPSPATESARKPRFGASFEDTGTTPFPEGSYDGSGPIRATELRSQPEPRIYAVSRASVPERPAMWQKLRAEGANIISSWIDEAAPGASADISELWQRIENEVRSTTRVVMYVEASDFPLKGALVEVGMALGMGKEVWIVAPGVELEPRSMRPLGSWVKHPNVHFCGDINDAVRCSNFRPAAPLPGPEKPEPVRDALQEQLTVAHEDLKEDFRWLQEISSALSSSRTRPDDLQSMLDEIYHLHCDLRELHNVNRIVSGLRSKGEARPAAITALKEIVELARLADDISVCNDIAEIAEKAIAESPTGQPPTNQVLRDLIDYADGMDFDACPEFAAIVRNAEALLGAVAQTATPPEEK